MCVCVCKTVHVCVPESMGKKETERERMQEEIVCLRSGAVLLSMDGAAAMKSSPSLQSIHSLRFNVYPFRGLDLGLMAAIHMLFFFNCF